MMQGSLDNGAIDTEYSPPIARVAPPLGDVVHAHEATIVRLQSTVAHQAEEMHLQRNAITALTARVYALEMSVKELEAGE